jgi:hypothetical protein
MKALEPEGPPRAHLQGIHRVTTIPMTTTMTTNRNEVGLVGQHHRYAVDVGGIAKVKKKKKRVEPRVDVDLLGRVHRGGTPKATIVIVGAKAEIPHVLENHGRGDDHRVLNPNTIDSTRLTNDYDYLRA